MRVLSLFVIAELSSAQSVLDLGSSFPSLTKLSALISASPMLTALLNGATDFTFLGPTNEALSKWLQGNHSQDFVDATLSYHLLAGSHPTVLLNNEASFIPTALKNPSYDNVTGGQRVEASKAGNVVFLSGSKTISTVVSGDNLVIQGGTVHIIDTVLQIPSNVLTAMTQAGLSYAVGIFSLGLRYAQHNSTISDATINGSDLTYFVPNSPKALSTVSNTSITTQMQLGQLTAYHFIVGSVLYSSFLRNGTVLTTFAGLPVVVRVLEDGTKYINSAKIIASDYLISSGVMHVIDDILIPSNTTGPVVTSTTTSVSTPSSTETTSNPSATASQKLSAAACAGIGVGVGITLLSLVALGIILYIKRKRQALRSQGNRFDEQHNGPFELKTNDREFITPQLETREQAVELLAT
ncbi:FAS1 domain-containing protein [Halenospora varia]|nr:FAS1 domain-containing protein [Halenospora varia]